MRLDHVSSAALIEDDNDSNQVLLSREARANLDLIQAMIGQNEVDEGEHSAEVTAPRDSTSIPVPAVSLKRRKLNEVAEATVQMIHEEIAHWEKGIQEIEYLISLSENHTNEAGHGVLSRQDENRAVASSVLPAAHEVVAKKRAISNNCETVESGKVHRSA
jgi:hypothetical protein